MPRTPSPTWNFSLVVARLGHRFLLVHERKHGQHWYLPAGRVEAGETFAQGAIRETKEESGIDVVLEGILRVERSPMPDGVRQRVIFVARPSDDSPPKAEPDEETLGAAWVSVEQLSQYSLRGKEVREILEYVENGGTIFPLALLQPEGSNWP